MHHIIIANKLVFFDTNSIAILFILYNRIAQTFASGKTEKLVYQCIGEVGLPNGKVREIGLQNSSNNHVFFYVYWKIF